MDSSQMGKKSWEVRKSPEEIKRLKEISAIGVIARRQKRMSINSVKSIQSQKVVANSQLDK